MRFPLPRRSVLRACVLAGLALPGLFACTDDLPKITLIRQLEVLGARVEVVGDTERSTPVPGEEVVYRPFAALPEPEQDRSGLATLMIECTQPDFELGVPVCQEFIDVAGKADGPGDDVDLGSLGIDRDVLAALDCDDEPFVKPLGPLFLHCAVGAPSIRFSLPEASSSSEGPDAASPPGRLLTGVMCNDGIAALDPQAPGGFACKPRAGKDPRDVLELFDSVRLRGPDEPDNHHPDPSGLRLTVDDAPWDRWEDEAPPTPDDCGALPQVELGQKVVVGIFYRVDLLESVDGVAETLELSSYATAGEVSRRYTIFEPEAPIRDGEVSAELDWTAPTEEQNKALERRSPDDPVRFYVAIRDKRGGFSVAEYYLCVK